MKILLFSRRQVAHTPEELNQLFETIDRFGFDYAVNAEFAEFVHETDRPHDSGGKTLR